MKYPMEAFVSSITVSKKEEEKQKVQLRGYEAQNFFFCGNFIMLKTKIRSQCRPRQRDLIIDTEYLVCIPKGIYSRSKREK